MNNLHSDCVGAVAPGASNLTRIEVKISDLTLRFISRWQHPRTVYVTLWHTFVLFYFWKIAVGNQMFECFLNFSHEKEKGK